MDYNYGYEPNDYLWIIMYIYEPNESRYKPNESRYKSNESRYKPNESRYKSNESRYEVNTFPLTHIHLTKIENLISNIINNILFYHKVNQTRMSNNAKCNHHIRKNILKDVCSKLSLNNKLNNNDCRKH